MRATGLGLLAVLALTACGPTTDEVFVPLSLTSTAPFTVDEGAGVVQVPVRLARARDRDFSLAYRVVGLDAQEGCQSPDFGAADGRVEWPAGALEASVPLWVAEDELAEGDERVELRLEAADGASVIPLGRIDVVIADNDRTALLSAEELGVIPGALGDQSAALQAALDRARELGRGVLVMSPGDYEISSVQLGPGTTLSARGVRWHRPPSSAVNTVSLRIEHEGAEPSSATLVEGLSIDGRRGEQGPYQAYEAQEAHLMTLAGDNAQGGALRVQLEQLELVSGTGSGLWVSAESDVSVCGLRAGELWRDALTLNGGATRLRLRDFDATKTQGTGLWLGAREPGFGDSYRIDVEAEDVRVGAGDVEIEASDRSRVSIQRLTMTAPPFRLDAPGGSVRVEDSVLMLGPPPHNRWGEAHDVEIVRTVLVASEEIEAESSRGAPVRSPSIALGSLSYSPGPSAGGEGQIAFIDCRFELGRDVPNGEAVYAIENAAAETSVLVDSCELGPGFAGWFGSECSRCVAP